MKWRHAAPAIFGLTVFAALFLWFSSSPIPGWLLVVIIAAAIPSAIATGLRQKRLERKMLRGWWNSRAR
jgi:hypothetical protein